MEQGRHKLYRLSRVHCCSTSDSQPSQDRSTPGSYIPVSSIHLDVTSMMTKTCSVNSKCLIDDSVWLVCDWQASTTLAIAGLYVFLGGPKWCVIQKLLWVFLAQRGAHSSTSATQPIDFALAESGPFFLFGRHDYKEWSNLHPMSCADTPWASKSMTCVFVCQWVNAILYRWFPIVVCCFYPLVWRCVILTVQWPRHS